jgi:CRP-like cAMP-binding protein
VPCPPVIPVANLLLTALPEAYQAHFLSRCETVDLIFSEVLYHAGELIPHIYFPTGSFISLVMHIDHTANLEVGLIGNEGMLGVTVMLGVDTAPFDALVQGSGQALRISSAAFLSEIGQNPVFLRKLQRYLYVSMRQIAQTTACNRFHVVGARLARWLLMTQDRAHSDCFHITHVFLAYMLGVRRVGITKAAHELQQMQLISYQRGDIKILDRAGLEAVACGCYQADKEVYERILGK